MDAVLTLRGLRGAGRLVFAGDGVWRASRTVQGPATVQIIPGEGPRDTVLAHAWGPGRELALELVADALGLHDDPGAYTPCHPVLRDQHRLHPGLRLGRTRSVVEALLPTIVAQKVPAADATRSWRAVRRWLGDPAPGPADLILPPDPARLALLAYHDLHRFGIDRRRAEPLLAACRVAGRLDRLDHDSPAHLMAGLTQIPGIGPWTASSVSAIALGDPDNVVVGDYGIPSVVAWVLAGERTADDARMLELLEPERPQRARALRLIAASGKTPPRHGPRMAPAFISARRVSPGRPPRSG